MVRADKWLWAARFFKTRSLARAALEGGKVQIDGVRAKPSREMRLGQTLSITRGHDNFIVVVEGIAEQRMKASIATKLYRETEESIAARASLHEMQRLSQSMAPIERPDTRERHAIRRLRGKE